MFLDNFDIINKETGRGLSSLDVVEDLFINILRYGGPSNTNNFNIDKKLVFIESFLEQKNCGVEDLLKVFYIIKKRYIIPDISKLKI
jgi:hypothetical protein